MKDRAAVITRMIRHAIVGSIHRYLAGDTAAVTIGCAQIQEIISEEIDAAKEEARLGAAEAGFLPSNSPGAAGAY